MNTENVISLQFCLFYFICGFVLYLTCDLKRKDNVIERVVYVYSIVDMVIAVIGIIASIVLFILDLF